MRACVDILKEIGHPDWIRLDKEAKEYLEDIQRAVEEAVKRSDKVELVDGTSIPYVPNEIHQTKPPEFSPVDFWPYINYVDVGPLHLVDADVLYPNSDIVKWVLEFEEKYSITKLKEEISVNENWCFSIKEKGEKPAHLLRHGISVIEPFYALHATAYFRQDNIEKYLEVFYNQMAGAVSHRTLTNVENRYGVWNLPWADAEFLKMLRRMLVQEKGDELLLLYGIPRKWLEEGEKIEVKNLPTYFGNISFSVLSEIENNQILMTLHPPDRNPPKKISIRFRHPLEKEVRGVWVDGREWKVFEKDVVRIDSIISETMELRICF